MIMANLPKAVLFVSPYLWIKQKYYLILNLVKLINILTTVNGKNTMIVYIWEEFLELMVVFGI